MNDSAANEAEVEGQERLATEVLNRFVELVLFARRGDGTWPEGSVQTAFHVLLPSDNDADFLVQINDDLDR